MTLTLWLKPRRASFGAVASVLRMIGAPHMWVAPWWEMAWYMLSAVTLRRQMLVPATAASVHGKHQPLQ